MGCPQRWHRPPTLWHISVPLCAMAQDGPPTPSAVAAVAEPSPLPRDTGAPRGQARPALAWHNGCSVRVLETDGASAARAGHACLGPLTPPGQRHPVHGTKSTPSWTGTEECPHADTGAQQEGCSQQRDLTDGDMGTGGAMPSCQETATKCSYVPSIALGCRCSAPCSTQLAPGVQGALPEPAVNPPAREWAGQGRPRLGSTLVPW